MVFQDYGFAAAVDAHAVAFGGEAAGGGIVGLLLFLRVGGGGEVS